MHRSTKEEAVKRRELLAQLENMFLDGTTNFGDMMIWHCIVFSITILLQRFIHGCFILEVCNSVCVFLGVILLRHKQSWEVVNAFVDNNMKVWLVKPEQTVLPTVLPWVEGSLENMTFLRSVYEEGCVLWVNMTTARVMPLMKKNYIVSLVTGLLTAMPGNSVAIIIHANRASESKAGPTAQLFQSQISRYSSVFVENILSNGV